MGQLLKNILHEHVNKTKTLIYNKKYLQIINSIGLGDPLWKLPTQLQNWRTWVTDFNPINLLMATGEIKKRYLCHNLPQAFRRRKYECLVLICPTDILQSHPRISFSINELWSNKYDTHRSKINKRRLELITWRIV